MQISVEKSWTWATTRAARKKLTAVKLHGQTVQSKQRAKDLGCDVAYSKRVTKKVWKTRLNKSLRILRKIRGRKFPKSFKKTMRRSLGLGTVSYGSELQRFSHTDLHKLRAAHAQALGYNRSGANVFLAGNITGEYEDPQISLLKRKVFFSTIPETISTKEGELYAKTMQCHWASSGTYK